MVGKKKYTCTVKVSAAKKASTATSQPQVMNIPATIAPTPTGSLSENTPETVTPTPTGSPSEDMSATIAPVPTESPSGNTSESSVKVIEYDGSAVAKKQISDVRSEGVLYEVIVKDNVTSIGESEFEEHTKMTSITIPGSVTSIGEGAFSYCGSLTNLSWKNTVYENADAFLEAFNS